MEKKQVTCITLSHMSSTSVQYDAIVSRCQDIFQQKNNDYGPSWRLFRPSSLTDQILIKAQRIRNIESSGKNHVGDSITGEFLGIVNYSLMALIQLRFPVTDQDEPNSQLLNQYYSDTINETKALMMLKNSDYGEVWREMRISSLTDMILVKLARIKQIEDNLGVTQASEGADANYQDIINYAIFALIRLSEPI
jgi:hypothetical protein